MRNGGCINCGCFVGRHQKKHEDSGRCKKNRLYLSNGSGAITTCCGKFSLQKNLARHEVCCKPRRQTSRSSTWRQDERRKISHLSREKLFYWQGAFLSAFKLQCVRTIFFVQDSAGGRGKSFIADKILADNPEGCLIWSPDADELKYGGFVNSLYKAVSNSDGLVQLDQLIVDMPRGAFLSALKGGKHAQLSQSAMIGRLAKVLEDCKNGRPIRSTRLISVKEIKIANNVSVTVMTNQAELVRYARRHLSADRPIVFNLDTNKPVVITDWDEEGEGKTVSTIPLMM